MNERERPYRETGGRAGPPSPRQHAQACLRYLRGRLPDGVTVEADESDYGQTHRLVILLGGGPPGHAHRIACWAVLQGRPDLDPTCPAGQLRITAAGLRHVLRVVRKWKGGD